MVYFADEVQAPLPLFYILVCLTSPFPPFSLLLPTWDPLLCRDGLFTLFPAWKAAYFQGALVSLGVPHSDDSCLHLASPTLEVSQS